MIGRLKACLMCASQLLTACGDGPPFRPGWLNTTRFTNASTGYVQRMFLTNVNGFG